MNVSEPHPRPLAIVGVTASGKSRLALELARRLGGIELVSVDSMQVYRGMDIGTAKPPAADRCEVPHHLLDIADPHEEFTVSRFQRAATEAVAGIEARGNRAVLVGGTGLYLRAAIDGFTIPGRWPEVVTELEAEPDTRALHRRLVGLDPQAAGRMEPTNRRRVLRALEVTLGSGRRFSSFGPGLDRYPPTRFDLVGLWLPRAVLADRIEQRYRHQVADGFVDEVRRLTAGPERLSRTAAQALGYRELASHLQGECSLDEALDLAVRRTRKFARRQRVWFGRDPRITWIDASSDPRTVLPRLVRHATRSPTAPDVGRKEGGDAVPRLRQWDDMHVSSVGVSQPFSFTKHHGLGNDFLIVFDQPADADLARRICDRRRGVGADGMVSATTGGPDGADLTMVLFNADGSRAETSGNGLRCLAQAEAQRRDTATVDLVIATDAGPRRVAVRPGPDDTTAMVTVDMGKALPGPEPDRKVEPTPDESGQIVTRRRELTVDMGNPHVVYLVDTLADVELAVEGAFHQRAYSAGINVEFIAPTPGEVDALDLRVWERGAGVTEACGSGACAAAYAAHHWGLVGEQVRVHMPGGEVEVVLGDTVTLVGPAAFVARVEIDGGA